MSISAQKNERDDPEHVGGGRHRMADTGQRDLERVERAGADIAETTPSAVSARNHGLPA
jgi:hypothetical protein